MIDGRKGCFGGTQSFVWRSLFETVANWRQFSSKEWAAIADKREFSEFARWVFVSDKCFHCGRTSTRTWLDRGFCTKHKADAISYVRTTPAMPAASLEKLKAFFRESAR